MSVTERPRRASVRAATFTVLGAGIATAVSALPLFAGVHAEPLVIVHVAAATVFFAGVGVKLALLGARARPRRARRLWRLLVAQLGAGLAAYTLLTGILVVLDPAWSDQHLAASFWLGFVVTAHARQYGGRLRGSVHPPPAADEELQAALRRLDPATLSLLDLSIRKGVSETRLATVLGIDERRTRQRLESALLCLDCGGASAKARLRRLPAEAWTLPPRRRARRRLVVVGGGMAGQAVVELVAGTGAWHVTLLAREECEPYNRIALADVVGGRATAGQLALRPQDWYEAAEVDLRLCTAATALSIDGRSVTDTRGAVHRYDALVLATGSRPVLPPIDGARLPHVVAHRTMDDAERLAVLADRAATAVVIGGGPLGLEAAAALSERGVAVTVVHSGERLMSRQLDDGAAALLRRSLARLGVEVVLATTVTEIAPGHVRLAEGSSRPADVVVVAAGIQPETSLARAAGIDVARGIVVDASMRTSASGVWAVGECAEYAGVVHGLWAPVSEQVRAAVASLEDRSAPFRPAPAQTLLKVPGIEVFAAGQPTARPGEHEVVRCDGRHGRYAKVVVDGDRLVGAVLVGDLSAAPRLRALLATGDAVPLDVLDTSPPPGMGSGGRSPSSAEPVCRCMAVSRERIEQAIDEEGLDTVDGVAATTGAGTGCGSCAASVARILEEHRARTCHAVER